MVYESFILELWYFHCTLTEAVVRRYSMENVFLEISQNSQENTCGFCEISKRTPRVAASAISLVLVLWR